MEDRNKDIKCSGNDGLKPTSVSSAAHSHIFFIVVFSILDI